MENNNSMQETQNNNEDLAAFFNNFIKSGVITKEREVVPGFTPKIKVLNTGELLSAESIMVSFNNNIPMDIIIKARAASILSQAILSINGIPIEKDDLDKEKNYQRRQVLHKSLLDMPAIIVQKTYELYIECVEEQNLLYSDNQKLNEKTENF